MSHGPNRYRAEKRAAEWAVQRAGAVDRRAATGARRVIEAWNARARLGKPALYPTFETALTSGCVRLTYCCPACRQMATVDLRDFAERHHPQAPISMLIPKLSCDRCCPNPPLAVLVELESPAAALPTSKARASREADRPPAEPPWIRPTLSALARVEPHWLWLHCEKCRHKRAAAIVPFVIRWGPDAPGDRLRSSVRCTKCDHKGALIYAPSWVDTQIGWQPFPKDGDDR